ncbi:MAG: hypothetical protein KKC51_13335, partial [Verrucomicrobia bacterium]|nr:hypothetical protein [Verrucomicrobiota bacterium]
MRRIGLTFFLSAIGWAAAAGAWEVRYSPVHPSFDQEILIQIRGAKQGAILHWGVNAVGAIWEPAIPAYRPQGSVM